MIYLSIWGALLEILNPQEVYQLLIAFCSRAPVNLVQIPIPPNKHIHWGDVWSSLLSVFYYPVTSTLSFFLGGAVSEVPLIT